MIKGSPLFSCRLCCNCARLMSIRHESDHSRLANWSLLKAHRANERTSERPVERLNDCFGQKWINLNEKREIISLFGACRVRSFSPAISPSQPATGNPEIMARPESWLGQTARERRSVRERSGRRSAINSRLVCCGPIGGEMC